MAASSTRTFCKPFIWGVWNKNASIQKQVTHNHNQYLRITGISHLAYTTPHWLLLVAPYWFGLWTTKTAFHFHLTGVEPQGALLDLLLPLLLLWGELDHITEHAWLEVHTWPLFATDAVEQDIQPTGQDACLMRVSWVKIQMNFFSMWGSVLFVCDAWSSIVKYIVRLDAVIGVLFLEFDNVQRGTDSMYLTHYPTQTPEFLKNTNLCAPMH